MSTSSPVLQSSNSSDFRREMVEGQMCRILSSPVLRRADGLCRLLRFIVDRTLAGDRASLKEYCLAVEVFGRTQDFDPKDFALVRVQATRLRYKLEQYYRKAGRTDPILITIPRGGYAAHFDQRPASFEPASLGEAAKPEVSLVPADLNPEVCVARARHLLSQWNQPALLRCAGLCRSAMRAGIGDRRLQGLMVLSLCGLHWFDQLPPQEIVPLVRDAAAEALNGAPAEGRIGMAWISWLYDRDGEAARRHLQAALRISPGSEMTAYLAELRRACAGQPRRGHGEGRSATGSLLGETARAMVYLPGDPGASTPYFLTAAALEEHSPLLQWGLGVSLLRSGRYDEAEGPLARAVSLGGCGTLASSALAYVWAKTGRVASAVEWLEQTSRSAARTYVSGVDVARVHAGLGNTREALRCLEEANQLRSARVFSALLCPEFAPLRGTRRFAQLTRAICDSAAESSAATA